MEVSRKCEKPWNLGFGAVWGWPTYGTHSPDLTNPSYSPMGPEKKFLFSGIGPHSGDVVKWRCLMCAIFQVRTNRPSQLCVISTFCIERKRLDMFCRTAVFRHKLTVGTYKFYASSQTPYSRSTEGVSGIWRAGRRLEVDFLIGNRAWKSKSAVKTETGSSLSCRFGPGRCEMPLIGA